VPGDALCAGQGDARFDGARNHTSSGTGRRDGLRRLRKSSYNMAYAHTEGDQNVVLARAVPLGGRAVDLWFACALLTHRRP